MKSVIVHVNGVRRRILGDPATSLLVILRDHLGLAGTKVGCAAGQCGACSVFLDGSVVRACMTRLSDLRDEAIITTIESLNYEDTAEDLQTRWAKLVWRGTAQNNSARG